MTTRDTPVEQLIAAVRAVDEGGGRGAEYQRRDSDVCYPLHNIRKWTTED